MECAVCRDKLECDQQQIECGHCFHYHCIYMSLFYNKQGGIKLECPLCRGSVSKIPLRNGYTYDSSIHQSPDKKYCQTCCKLIRSGDYCSKHKPVFKCKYIITRGKNKGDVCGKTCRSEFCAIHSTKTDTKTIAISDWIRIVQISKEVNNKELLAIIQKY